MIDELINGKGIRQVIEDSINEIHKVGPVNPAILERLSVVKKYHSDVFSEYEAKLLSVMGLFYKLDEPDSIVELIYKTYGEAIKQKFGHSFTPIQASAFKSIQERKFYSFSAPTSTGKSHLFRELIKEYDRDIVIIVPSRALIAEFYSAVIGLVDNDILVLQFVEDVNRLYTSRRIFILTPERGIEIFKYSHEFNVGLFLFDEAQISEDEIRGISFDAFVRRVERVFPNATKVFAHPFVANPGAQMLKHGINEDCKSEAFKQSGVGRIHVAMETNGSFTYFSPYDSASEVGVEGNIIVETLLHGGSVLVYISKNKIFSDGHIADFAAYINLCEFVIDKAAKKIIDELEQYIGASNTQLGKKSSFIELMKRGVVVHHGSMPLKARLMIENFVSNGHARICFATSTLSQGINMPFDCVCIDNFNRMDALTLKNLVGRSGRSSKLNKFDFGYTIVHRENVATFCERIKQDVTLSEKSKIDEDFLNVPLEYVDLVEAVKNDKFNDDLHLTEAQIDRIRESNLKFDIRYIFG